MKKIIIILLLFLCVNGIGFCQNSQKYLVLTFNCVYEIGEYKHGTGITYGLFLMTLVKLTFLTDSFLLFLQMMT